MVKIVDKSEAASNFAIHVLENISKISANISTTHHLGCFLYHCSSKAKGKDIDNTEGQGILEVR